MPKIKGISHQVILTPGVPFRPPLGAAYPGVRGGAFPLAIRKLQREILVASESPVEVNWLKGLDKRKMKKLIGSGLFGLTVSRDDVNVRNKTVYREG